jgi:antitoxin (DNA-binding transcriptional repressor) of toxin-antitoxin stability system
MMGGLRMTVSSTDFKTNLGKYLNMVSAEDIVITRNGRRIAKLVKEGDNALSDVRSLFGMLADSELAKMDDAAIKEAIRTERGKRNDGLD